jgi:hypothetical protein
MTALRALAVLGLGAACVAQTRHHVSREAKQQALLEERAAFDLQCPQPQLRTQELGNEQTKGVAGCGRRAVYLYDYGHDAWLMNGTIEPEQTAGPGATEVTNSPSSASREDASR